MPESYYVPLARHAETYAKTDCLDADADNTSSEDNVQSCRGFKKSQCCERAILALAACALGFVLGVYLHVTVEWTGRSTNLPSRK